MAYEGDLPVIGPDGDPEGWKIFPEIHLDGRLFRAVDICVSISVRYSLLEAFGLG